MHETSGFGKLETLFGQLMGCHPEERDAFLDAQCADKPGLRAQLVSLLEHASMDDGFLETPPTLEGIAPEDDILGERLGPYVVESEIAAGGMGRVYLARRDGEDFEQRVAIKVIKHGPAMGGAIDRFRAERRLLAKLDHPRIARLLDGGTLTDGRPYLVMDYVEGVRLDSACAGMSVEDRLDLFEKIADAVAYAHAQLVVHRDLKPSNILITPEGEPRLLDFGVAKVLEPDASELTRTGEHPLTPQYASPEQVRGEPVTTATDVYALGLLLYEMLTGRRPYELCGASPGDSSRVICDTTPSRPSAAASDAGTRNRLRGDLDRIVLKSLSKDPQDRYGSAALLAEDIRRWRRHEPVLAGPDTAAYRARKAFARHRVPIIAGLVAVVALAGGLAAALAGYSGEAAARRSEHELRLTAEAAEHSAIEQRAVAEQVGEFLDDMLSSIDPTSARDRDTTLIREVLDRAAGRLASDETIPARVRAPLEVRVGASYVAIEELDAGRDHLRRALDLFASAGGGESEKAAEAWHWLGRAEYRAGDRETGRSHVMRALQLRRDLLPEGAIAIGQSLTLLGAIQIDLGDLDGAMDTLQEALTVWRRHTGSRGMQVLNDTAKVAGVFIERGELERAAELLATATASLTDETRVSPAGASILNMRAIVARRLERFEEAEAYSRESIEVVTRIFGDDNPNTLTLRANHAVLLESLGRLEEAEALHLAVLELREQTLAPGHPDVASSWSNLTLLRSKRGHHEGAIDAGRRAYELSHEALGPEHPSTHISRAGLGVALMRSEVPANVERAELHLIAALRGLEAALGSDHGAVIRTRAYLVELYGPARLDRPESLAGLIGVHDDAEMPTASDSDPHP